MLRSIRTRIAISSTLAVGGVALLAAPAQATFHLNMVNEVMLASASGDASTQFVEFLDHGGTEEQFTPVFAPYKLVVYDAAGNEVGEQQLDPAGLRGAAAANTEYLVSTPSADGAFGVAGNERLSVSLPQTGGQVCFAGSESPPQAVSCMSYGTITKPVQTNSTGTGTVHGPLPPNGESDQRQSDGSVVAAPPTPKARNHAASSPATAGKPALSRLSLTGVAKRKARLGFTALAGSGAPALAKIVIALPHGLAFDAKRLRRGLTGSGPAGRRLRFSAHVRHGALTISLSTAVTKATLIAGGGSITVTKDLAKRVKQHKLKRLAITVTVTDAKGNATRFVPNLKPS